MVKVEGNKKESEKGEELGVTFLFHQKKKCDQAQACTGFSETLRGEGSSRYLIV